MKPLQPVHVWDLPTRLFHWLLVLLLLGAYGSARFGWLSMEWHFRFGYALAGLLAFRLVWGLIGGLHARFHHFLAGPVALWRHLCSLTQRQPSGSAGHNALGGWAVLLMLALLIAQVVTGLYASDDIFMFGPLNATVSAATARELTRWHVWLQDLLLLVIALHLLALAWYRLVKRESLVLPMISGRKALPPSAADPRSRVPWWRLLPALAVAGGLVWWLMRQGA